MAKRNVYILVNTGSPATLAVSDVRSYLSDFLTDKRVINMPRLLRIPIFKWFVAPRRAPHSAEKYAMIWEEEGSLLVIKTHSLARKLQHESGFPVFVVMRYSQESIEETLKELNDETVANAYIVPLFPHYAMSSFETAVAHIQDWYDRAGHSFYLMSLRPYYDNALYIDALVEQIAQNVKPQQHLLFSYHGIPISQTRAYKGNPYKDYEWQTTETTRLVMSHPSIESLNLTYEIAYQSRFGNNKWLAPTTEQRLLELPSEGHKSIAVVCPSFVCDCLETLWEIGIEGKEKFVQAGGSELTLVPCPNDSDLMVRAIQEHTIWNYSLAKEWTKP